MSVEKMCGMLQGTYPKTQELHLLPNIIPALKSFFYYYLKMIILIKNDTV